MEYIAFLNIFMLSRLAYLFEVPQRSNQQIVVECAIQILTIALMFEWDWSLLAIAVVLAGSALLNAKCTRTDISLDGLRGLTFIVVAIVASFTFNENTTFSPWFLAALDQVARSSVVTKTFTLQAWSSMNLIAAGALFLANEVNLLMRYFFHKLKLEPQLAEHEGDIDEAEYNAGRVIGILERNLIYLVVIIGNSYAAVGFILAAKGFARFKQLDERHFAEYMLVGTLTSTLITLIVASMVKFAGM